MSEHDLTPIQRLTKDMAVAAATLSDKEARFLVDAYYTMQDSRIRHDGQVRALTTSEEPHLILQWFADQASTLEKQIQRALDKYSAAHPDGDWLRALVGIGPVLAAGFLAHIDITKAPTAGALWRYAGLDPTSKWEPKTKRPWNAELKLVCWKAGESFVKNANREGCYYGQVYQTRKAFEVANNEAGKLADQAAAALKAKTYRKDTDAYKAYIQGKLPPAHVHARARRYAVKLFLAHFHHVLHVKHFGVEPPLPYPIAELGHAHYLKPPGI